MNAVKEEEERESRQQLVQSIQNRLLQQPSLSFTQSIQLLDREFFQQYESKSRSQVILACLVALSHSFDEHNIKLCHLLLRLIGDNASHLAEDGEMRKQAADLFQTYCAAKQHRLAVKTVQTFALKTTDVSLEDVSTYIDTLLGDKSSHAPALSLLLHFPELRHQMDCAIIIRTVARGNCLEKSVDWVKTLECELHDVAIAELLAADRIKAAWIMVKALGLEEKYAHVRRMYKEKQVLKLTSRQVWGAAFIVAECDRQLQSLVLDALMKSSDAALALEFQRMYNLPDDLVQIDEQTMAELEAKRNQTYYPLCIALNCIHFIDNAEQIEQVYSVLKHEKRIGIDAEWKSTPEIPDASILQLAGKECCFILDLHALRGTESLNQIAASLFLDEMIQKVGFSISIDVKIIKAVCQIKQVENVVDLQTEFGKTMTEMSKHQNISLSGMVERFLGKPLDKAMQLSDWSMRPLTERQIRYAAQDAHVLLALHDKLLSLTTENE